MDGHKWLFVDQEEEEDEEEARVTDEEGWTETCT